MSAYREQAIKVIKDFYDYPELHAEIERGNYAEAAKFLTSLSSNDTLSTLLADLIF